MVTFKGANLITVTFQTKPHWPLGHRELAFLRTFNFHATGGRVHEDALDLLSEACGAIGGSPVERQALLTYWRQRVSMANARGVAAVIKARTPLCTGVHHPVQPHHFSHQSAIPAPLRPQQTPHQAALPALTAWPLLRPPAGAGFCLPCTPNLRTAGCAATSPHSLLVGADDAGLVAGHASG